MGCASFTEPTDTSGGTWNSASQAGIRGYSPGMKHRVLASAVVFVFILGSAAPGEAGTDSAATSLGKIQVTIDDRAFEDECTAFPVAVSVTGTGEGTEWSAEITAVKDSESLTASVSGTGDGGTTTSLMICAPDGVGTWTTTVSATLIGGSGFVRPVDSATLNLSFEALQATTETSISSIRIRSGETRVKGSVTQSGSGSALVGDQQVKIRAKKPGKSWKDFVTGTTDADGEFSLTVGQEFPEGTKVKAVFLGTDAAAKSTSDITEV